MEGSHVSVPISRGYKMFLVKVRKGTHKLWYYLLHQE